MTQEEKQPTDAANQAPEIDFGDDSPAEETATDAESETLDQQKTQTSQEGDTAEQQSKGIDQESVNKRINKLTFEKYEERRKREQLESELNSLKSAQSKSDESVTVPEMPDIFDPQYDSKIAEREKALQRAAQIQAQKDYEARLDEQKRAEQQQSQQQQAQKWVTDMYTEAEKLGIEKDDLQKADHTVATFIKDQGLARFIISQKEAPLIINHLAKNAAELEHISALNPIDAAAYIASKVIPAAAKYKPNLSKAPDPLDIPDGKAAGKAKSPYLDGVTFE